MLLLVAWVWLPPRGLVVSSAAGDARDAAGVARDAILLALAVVAVLSVIGLLTIDPLFTSLGADGAELDAVREYMTIWYLGMVFLVVPMVSNGAIRSTGDTRAPAVIMVIAAAVNVAIDPLLMFGPGPFPELGLRGAAIASVIARFLTLLASLWLLIVRRRLVSFRPPTLGEFGANVRALSGLAVPAALSAAVVPVSLGVLTAIVAAEGRAAVAAFAAGGRVTTILVLAAMATGAGLVPFVAQNMGSGHRARIAQSLSLAIRAVTVIAAIGWLLAVVFRAQVGSLFTSDPAIADVLDAYVVIALAGSIGMSVQAVAVGVLNGLQAAGTAAVVNIVRLAVLVPAAWLGSRVAGTEGIWVAMLATETIVGLLAVLVARQRIDGVVPIDTPPSAGRDAAPVESVTAKEHV